MYCCVVPKSSSNSAILPNIIFFLVPKCSLGEDMLYKLQLTYKIFLRSGEKYLFISEKMQIKFWSKKMNFNLEYFVRGKRFDFHERSERTNVLLIILYIECRINCTIHNSLKLHNVFTNKKNPKSFFHLQTTQTFIGLSLVLEIGTKVRQKMALTMSYLKVLLLNLHTAVLNIK